MLIFLLVRRPCQNLDPYDNSFYDFSLLSHPNRLFLGSPKFCFNENLNLLGDIGAHAKFQNRSINPSGRKVCGTERKKRKIITKIVDTSFRSHANGQCTHSARTNYSAWLKSKSITKFSLNHHIDRVLHTHKLLFINHKTFLSLPLTV